MLSIALKGKNSGFCRAPTGLVFEINDEIHFTRKKKKQLHYDCYLYIIMYIIYIQ